MNRDDVEPGTVTREKLVSIGWDDEEDEVLAKKWRVPLARADGLLNTANEVPRVWYHENDWTGDDGRARTVRGHSRARAIIDFTNIHVLAL